MLLLVFGPLKITNCLEQGIITLLKVWQNRGGTFGPDLDQLNILCSKMPSHKKVKKLDNSQVKKTFYDKFQSLCPKTRHNKTGQLKFRFCNTSTLIRFIKNIRNLDKYIPRVFKETKASFQQHISEKKSKGMFSVFRFDLNSTWTSEKI